MTLPDATKRPCSECPWRRESAAGWLGPMGPLDWLRAADGELAIACHKTIKTEDGESVGNWDDPDILQCKGVAVFRANTCKEPRDPEIVTGPVDREDVFANKQEFYDHHGGEGELNFMDLMQPLGTPEGENRL